MKRRLLGFQQLLLLIITLATVGTPFAATAVSPQIATVTQQSTGKVALPVTDATLAEVQNYYARMGGGTGPVGVVVELEDTPAALVYAQSTKALRSAHARKQVNTIRQKQGNLISNLKSKNIKATEHFRTQKAYNGIWMRVDVNDLKTMAALPGVKAIHPIIPKVRSTTTSVPLINALQVWGGLGNYQGNAIKIGIIDTGIDYDHTNFGGSGTKTTTFPTAKVVGGKDFVGDAFDGSKDPVPDNDPMDCEGHGSHVAGIAAGFGVNTDGTTYVESGLDTYAALKDLSAGDYIDKFRIGPGVAPKAELYALRIFGCTGGTIVVTQAIEWAMDPNGDDDTSDHLDVINMSLGSKFGSPYDVDSIAADNAAKAGVIVVAAAGNEDDVNYITASPSVASYAMSVASSADSGTLGGGAFKVTATAASPSRMPVGLYLGLGAAFGPTTYSQSGDLIYASPANGCSTITNNLSGKIALIDREVCSFEEKVKNAQNAGALGVLIANNTGITVFVMEGMGDPAITIPSMMTTKSIGDKLKADLLAGNVSVLLTSTNNYTQVMTNPAIEDILSPFSSRGIARQGSILKPDITAPGDTIFSTKSGSGNQGKIMSGTSMASPHIAGVMALLKQIHPTWSVIELKALAMNTATKDLFNGLDKSGFRYTPSRVGAGRVHVTSAAESEVIAYNTTNPELVSVAFGVIEVLAGSQGSFVKGITINNKGTVSATYNVAFDSRYQANPGLIVTLLNVDGTALSNPVTVQAGNTLEIMVQISVNANLLTRALDPTLETGYHRERFSEGGGYVTLTSTSPGTGPLLRIPVHIAPRQASAMTVREPGIFLPIAAAGTFKLTPIGTTLATSDDKSLVAIMELMNTLPNEVSSSSPEYAASLQYVGAASDYPAKSFAEASIYFGIATYGRWDTPNSVTFMVYIDTDKDGIDDYVVLNQNSGLFNQTDDNDVMLSVSCKLSGPPEKCVANNFVNGFGGDTNTNLFNNNVMTLSVPLTGIGLVESGNTKFNFRVVSRSRDAASNVATSAVISYDVAKQAFTAVSSRGMPIWDDITGSTFDITYDKNAIVANSSKGLVLLHHHNMANSAQIVLIPTYSVTYNANGSSTGSAPAAQTKTHGIDLVLATNTGNLAKSGYTFAGWNSASNGSGTSYSVDATYSTDAAVTLYASWIPKLSVTVSGGGTGTVTSSPTGISCNKTGNDAIFCFSSFSGIVNLYATPSILSKFGGWDSACSGVDECSVNMTGEKSVTATFNLATVLHIGGTEYPTLQEAYNKAADGDVIQMLQDTVTGALTAGKSITVKLIGGYDSSYNTNPGITKVTAPVIISKGKLVVDGIVIR
jgi:uncharacterized repeat protein (TIGR02543 family)